MIEGAIARLYRAVLKRADVKRKMLPLAALALATTAMTLPGAAEARVTSIVLNARTGDVMSQDGADEVNYPASLTKMMTLYLVFERLDQGRLRIDQRIPVSDWAASQPPTGLGLREGQTIAVEDAILGLVTRSANDAATALGEALGGGSEPAFADMMTRKATQLGMTRTIFRNANGLPDPDQITSARDMARLSLALWRDFPHHYHYFSTPYFRYGGAFHPNHNRLLGSYAGADGLKTGYIRASGYNLAASAERDGVRLIGVVLGGRSSNDRNAVMTHLLDRGFDDSDVARPMVAAAPMPRHYAVAARAPATRVVALRARAVPVRTAAATLRGKHRAVMVASAAGRSHHVADRGRAPAGRWAIQVGAFKGAGTAHAAARRTAVAAPKAALNRSAVSVTRVKAGAKGGYRARFTGMSHKHADAACAALAKSRQPCAVIAPSGDFRVARAN